MSNSPTYQRKEYQARINRVIDYIDGHLDEQLSLEKLSEIANFSPYHFHRIFSAMMDETLNRFIQRLRLERAASRLVSNPKLSITEVAFEFGFSGSASFARSFKEYFGKSATDWRIDKLSADSKNCKLNSKAGQPVDKDRQATEVNFLYSYLSSQTHNKWRIEMTRDNATVLSADVEVKELPDIEVAYVRHIGPYAGDAKLFEGLFAKIMTGAGPRGLIRFPETLIMSVYHDDPNITDEAKLRTSICITVPKETKSDGEIGRMKIAGGTYAIARFEIFSNQYPEAWQSIYGGWLPDSGYQPDDGAPFEIYRNDPREHPEGKCLVDICVPVKPL